MNASDDLTLDALWNKLADTSDLAALAALVRDNKVNTNVLRMLNELRTLARQLGALATHSDLVTVLRAMDGAELKELRRASAALEEQIEREVLRRAALLLATLRTT